MALGPLKFLHRDPKWRKSNKQNHRFINKYVDRALERQKQASSEAAAAAGRKSDDATQQRRVLLETMAAQTDDRIALRNSAIQAFVAAHETTACLISNIFFLLARHPAAWRRLREEILSTLGDAPLTFEAPTKLKYLRNVINESEFFLSLLSVNP